MTRFIRFLKTLPADKALQKVMKDMRIENSDPKYWASFTVFGMP